MHEADLPTAYWLDNAHDLLQAVSPDGRLLYVNRAWRETLGYSAEDVDKLTLFDVVAPDRRSHCEETFAQILAGEDVDTIETVFLAKDHRHVAVEGTCHCRRKRSRPFSVQGIFRDVTERNRLEEQLRQAQKMEALGLLASGVAHDFGNLLTTMSGTLDWMSADVLLQDRIHEGMARIRQSVEAALAITDRLRVFSRSGGGPTIVTDLNAVVANAVQLLERVIGHVRIESTLTSEACPIRIGEGHVEQLIMNLALNARDAMPKGGTLRISTSIEQSACASNKCTPTADATPHVLLTVADSGCGMDDNVRQHAFEPFFTTKKAGKGSGLGLSTVFGIVQQAGGLVSLDSAPGDGTVIFIRLPLVQTPPSM